MLGFAFTRPALSLILSSIGILLVAFLFFRWLSARGRSLLTKELGRLEADGKLRRMSVAEMES